MDIQPIVEGHGDVEAVPVLLRRLQAEASAYGFGILSPIRRKRSDFRNSTSVAKAVGLALKRGCSAVMILFDSDDDCPLETAPAIEEWAKKAAGAIPVVVVMAKREYEAWFLAAIESLRGKRGIAARATSHPDPEVPRDAKGELEKRMDTGRTYSETVDQAPLTQDFDFAAAYQACRSFRKLIKAFGDVARGAWLAAAQLASARLVGTGAR